MPCEPVFVVPDCPTAETAALQLTEVSDTVLVYGAYSDVCGSIMGGLSDTRALATKDWNEAVGYWLESRREKGLQTCTSNPTHSEPFSTTLVLL